MLSSQFLFLFFIKLEKRYNEKTRRRCLLRRSNFGYEGRESFGGRREVIKMLNAKVFANAGAAVMGVWVIACALFSYLMPDLLFSIAQSWMHTVNLETVKAAFAPDLGSLILGLATASGLTWITVYGTITLYNRWSK